LVPYIQRVQLAVYVSCQKFCIKISSNNLHGTGGGSYVYSTIRIASICVLIDEDRLYIMAPTEQASLPSFT
jgi:hypothetical protein